MKTIKNTCQNLIEFLVSSPYLFMVLIPIFYIALPTPQTKPIVFRVLTRIVPAEVQPEFNHLETAFKKVFCSSSAVILLWLALKGLQRLDHVSIKD